MLHSIKSTPKLSENYSTYLKAKCSRFIDYTCVLMFINNPVTLEKLEFFEVFVLNNIYSTTCLLGTLFLLSACVGNSPQSSGGIIIDTKGVDMSAYYQDLHECRNYASQVNTGAQIAGKTVSGAVIGGAIGAIAGDSDAAKRAAGVGGLLGAVKGSGQASREKQRVVKNCLRGRGYRVLN